MVRSPGTTLTIGKSISPPNRLRNRVSLYDSGHTIMSHWLCVGVSLRKVTHRTVNPVTTLAFVHSEDTLAMVPSYVH